MHYHTSFCILSGCLDRCIPSCANVLAIPFYPERNTNDILVWHSAGWCPCGCCQPKRSSALRHRRVFLDTDAEGTRKAAEAIWCWQSEMPGVWPGRKRFFTHFCLFKTLIFLDLVRWESLKTFNKRCYKCCSLRFNHVF